MESIIITVMIKKNPELNCDIELPVEESSEKALLDIIECVNSLWPEEDIDPRSCRVVNTRTGNVVRGKRSISEEKVLNGDIFYIE